MLRDAKKVCRLGQNELVMQTLWSMEHMPALSTVIHLLPISPNSIYTCELIVTTLYRDPKLSLFIACDFCFGYRHQKICISLPEMFPGYFLLQVTGYLSHYFLFLFYIISAICNGNQFHNYKCVYLFLVLFLIKMVIYGHHRKLESMEMKLYKMK